MIIPAIPSNEKERLSELFSFSILDTLSEKEYDSITTIASEICQTEIALITFVDNNRQWFKSKIGLDVPETSRDVAFCAHAINKPYEILIVDDAHQDMRFFDNPLVLGFPYIHFYAGVPLVTENGLPLGTLCVIDSAPKKLSDTQIKSLHALSFQVVSLLELRRKKTQLENALLSLEEKQHELESFAVVAAHDLKSPLNNISMLINVLKSDYRHLLDEDGQMFIDHLGYSAANLRSLIDGLLEYSRSENLTHAKKEEITVREFFDKLEKLFVVDDTCFVRFSTELQTMYVHEPVLMQILINLVANAIKYNDKEITEIEVGLTESPFIYELYVQDNGTGIAEGDREKIFTLFTINASADKYGQKGNGIGLATVKKMVEKSGGKITVSSELGKGTRFSFTIGK